MQTLAGKKVLCFIALPHHNRFLVPIMEALAGQGMEVVYFTAAAEGAFEITLNEAKLPYRHVLDYADEETARRVAQAMSELRPVLQEKILANPVLQSVPIVIQDKTIRGAVENYHGLDRMLAVEKPDLLFALHELNPWGKILGHLSHRHRIPYFTLQEGLYYADIHYYRFHTDYSTACIVWGDECREILMRAGCSDDKIYPLGNTHIWNAKKEFTDLATVERTRAALGIAGGKKIILFLMSHSHYHPFEPGNFLRWMKERGDFVAVFKWHPATGSEIIDRALEKFRKDPSIINVHEMDTYALIGASEICITVGNSTTGLETLAFGKPLLEVRLPDQPYSYSEKGVAQQAYGFENLGDQIAAILGNGVPPETAAKVQTYLEHNFTYRDDKTMERIVDLVRLSIAARNEQPRRALVAAEAVSVPCSIILPVDDCAPETLLATLQGIAEHSAPELYEVLIVDCAQSDQTKEILASLGGDVTIIPGDPSWNYAMACNAAAIRARGKYMVFLKPGVNPEAGWLDGLLEVTEQESALGIVGGQVVHNNGLLWHIGTAFDVNQSPFSLYRFLPEQFCGALKQREFTARQFPFLVSRELFCELGGLNPLLDNRLDDIDFCLAVKQAGRRVLYTPNSRTTYQASSWHPDAATKRASAIHFYSKWTGSLWQDDGAYLREDGLTHDTLGLLYRDLAGRVAYGAELAGREMFAATGS
ncbi:MAG TPA: glycosyltransferase, partial [Verrucomicrobiae bacterium]|nr:glycosyltransferase [Verrucomicrobiae bacterium]